MMEPLSHLRTLIASLDQELVDHLVHRAQLPRNERIYDDMGDLPDHLDAIAGPFAEATTLAGRVQILRPAYLQQWLPLLCAPNGIGERAPCMAADTACLDTLARRLALSVHVATRKREAIPETLLTAIQTGDPVQVEAVITHPEVEVDVLARIRARAIEGGANEEISERIPALYAEWIIPLSRKIQVHGLWIDSG